MDVIGILTLFGVIAIIFLLLKYLPSYAKKKGENLAIKEDIADITKKIEAARIEYSQALERLRSDLNASFHARSVLFGKELEIYEEVRAALVKLKNVAVKLRGGGIVSTHQGESEEERQERLKKDFQKAFDLLYPAIYHNQPFYPPEIFRSFAELLKLMNMEAFDYFVRGDRESSNDKYWRAAEKNFEEIIRQTDDICEVIRGRLNEPVLRA